MRLAWIVLTVLTVTMPVLAAVGDRMPDINAAPTTYLENGVCEDDTVFREIGFAEDAEKNPARLVQAFFRRDNSAKAGVPIAIVIRVDDDIRILADFNRDGIVDFTGAPGDPIIGFTICDGVMGRVQ